MHIWLMVLAVFYNSGRLSLDNTGDGVDIYNAYRILAANSHRTTKLFSK